MIEDVVSFWAASSPNWFEKSDAFDQTFRDRYLVLHEQVAARQHDAWIATPHGALALLILTDQFPRNAFRGTARMYATDPLARHYARQALDAGHIEQVATDLQQFFCLPFMHSEDPADQDLCLALCTRLDNDSKRYAEHHRDIVVRFGRFPHRNEILGRPTTEAEATFLREGGFTG
ncbi:MAG: DUF924 family protein [Proteobacteria bacterium]|nr:DUF924 family protein [Pseudomonadota bacterium]